MAKKATKKTTKQPRTANSARTVRGRPFEKGHKHAWKPGQSGNPAGRPRDTITPHLREIAREQAPGKDGRTYGRMVAEMLFAEALAGGKNSVQATKEILDRLEGRPRQAVDVTVDERKRELFENAIAALVEQARVSREEAIEQLTAIAPEMREWIN